MIRCWEVHRPDEGVRGWLVVDSLRNGIAFGGTQFAPDLTRDEVVLLARCMTWKLAAHGLPTGGAKAGLAVDPADPALDRKLAVFAEELREPLTTCAVVGKDLGATNPMLDAIYAHLGIPQLHLVQRRVPACPPRLRELRGYREAMTGQGIAWATRALLGETGLRNARVAIQGAGVVGLGAARRLEELGARTVAMSDARGSALFPAGRSWKDLEAVSSGGRLGIVPHGIEAPRDAALHASCDVLVLAARSHSVGARLAESIQASLVVEGSNFGLTDEARSVLHRRGITVLPDVLANSAAAAMTTRQLKAGGSIDDATLWTAIEAAITGAVVRAVERVDRHGGTLRDASLHLARAAGAWSDA